ncbi:glycosyltransferase family 9 protein [Alphaproteobacteria bacterium]|nr:glycosyltransferase family 9 protein [Alphaproteobacteria bacterium]
MNLLFISSNRLGDAIINIQVLNKFIRQFPNIKVTIVSGSLPMPLYDDYSNISSRILLVKKKFSSHWISLYFKLRNQKFDHIIDFRSSPISFFLKSKNKIIFKMIKNKNIYNQIHNQFNTDLVLDYTIKIQESRLKNIKDESYACIAPFANWMPKEWPIINFNKCCKSLLELGISKIFVLGSKDDTKRFHLLFKSNGFKIINKCGSNHLLDDLALLKKSSIFIGNDSGMMHLSSIAKTPSICLFGPTDDKIYFPKLSDQSYLVRSAQTHRELTSHILNLNNYDKCLMNDISYDKVELLMKKILNG